MKVQIDQVTCAGSRLCVLHAPGAIRMTLDSRGGELAESIRDGTATDEELWGAAIDCPWHAVILETDDGQRVNP